ncbi:MAG: DUF5615 family PIN-like protein [Candidatus Methylomirabilales bacterium]
MRILTDQDVYQITVGFLQSLGHDVLRAKDAGLGSASDVALLEYADREGRVLVTRDKGYGGITFLERQEHGGILLLRVTPATIRAVHEELRRFFVEHQTIEMQSKFVVIEPGRHRIRSTVG